VATRGRRRRTDLELMKLSPWKNSLQLPSEQRSARYRATGLQAAREAANMTQAEVAQACGYPVGVIASLERGTPHHTLTISRASSVIPNNDLRLIRDEGA